MSLIKASIILFFIITYAHSAFGMKCSNFAGHNLERLMDEAELLYRDGKKDAELSALITAVANDGIDVENMTPLQLEAFRLAGLIKDAPKKEWKKFNRFRNSPKTIELGAFPERGIDFVRAHIVMSELTLNGKVRERLQGVTYEINLSEGDQRSVGLDPITEGKISTWDRANSSQAYRRRKRLIHILKENFDYLSRKDGKRIIHSVISLARSESTPESYVLPSTQVDPLTVFKNKDDVTLQEDFNMQLRSHFLSILSGEREVTVLTGYQNGNAANPARGRQ